MNSYSIFTIGFIILGGTLICLYFYYFQPPNNFSVNEKADANEYLKIYEYFQGEREWQNIRFGIHNRIIAPYLASLFPSQDPTFNFFLLNSILAILSAIALFYLIRYFNLEKKHAILVMLFFSLHYVGPFRQNAVGPINVDMAVYLLEILFLWLLLKRKYLPLIILTPIAIATKEIFLALIIIFFFIGISWRYIFKDKSFSISALAAMLLIGLFTKWMLNEFFPSVSPERNSMLVMAFHIRDMILKPDHLWRWLLSLFAAFGGFIFLLIQKYKSPVIQPSENLIVYVLSLSVLGLSILGGMDYTRLIFLGFPYIIISIFLIAKPNNNTIWISFIISMILSRFWIKMPIISLDLSLYNTWMPEWAETRYLVYWSLVVIASLVYFIAFNKHFSRSLQD